MTSSPIPARWTSRSDGDIINAAAQETGLGPVVGVRTWGGVVGIDGRFTLVDGTSVTQPRYAFAFHCKGWGAENHGVDPGIEVPCSPADFFAAEDKQLDRAIAEAFTLLERHATLPSSRRNCRTQGAGGGVGTATAWVDGMSVGALAPVT